MIPDLDHPLCGTGEEDAGDVGVPGDVVDRSVVGRIRLQESESNYIFKIYLFYCCY